MEQTSLFPCTAGIAAGLHLVHNTVKTSGLSTARCVCTGGQPQLTRFPAEPANPLSLRMFLGCMNFGAAHARSAWRETGWSHCKHCGTTGAESTHQPRKARRACGAPWRGAAAETACCTQACRRSAQSNDRAAVGSRRRAAAGFGCGGARKAACAGANSMGTRSDRFSGPALEGATGAPLGGSRGGALAAGPCVAASQAAHPRLPPHYRVRGITAHPNSSPEQEQGPPPPSRCAPSCAQGRAHPRRCQRAQDSDLSRFSAGDAPASGERAPRLTRAAPPEAPRPPTAAPGPPECALVPIQRPNLAVGAPGFAIAPLPHCPPPHAWSLPLQALFAHPTAL